MPPPETVDRTKLKALVDKVGDRAFFTLNFQGIWGEAANLRGLVTVSTDLYDRPNFVKKLSEFILERACRRIREIAKTGIHSILYDQSWIGVGVSPQTYREFMLPYDREFVKAARE